MAKGLIMAGIAKNILLLTAETYTEYIHPQDKGNRTIFGDGASASLISTEGFAEIGEVVVGTDGSGAENLIVRSLGARHKEPLNDLRISDEEGLISGAICICMEAMCLTLQLMWCHRWWRNCCARVC